MRSPNNIHGRTNRMGSGLILLMIGLIFFLRNLGIGIPDWLFSWSTGLMVIGLVVGYRRDFNGGGWLIMVLIGGYFTLEDMVHMDLSSYYFAVGFIVLGLFLILKPGGKDKIKWKKEPLDFNFEPDTKTDEVADGKAPADDEDYIDTTNVFGSSRQQIYSKNFKGGDVVSVFGGCDLNLTQASFEGTITLDVVAVFGGVKIIIPPNWLVKSEITSVFGGVDDKRSVPPTGAEPQKTIKIIGVAFFGGVEIRNY